MWKLTENIPGFTYWKSVFLDIFCSVLTVLLDAPEIFSWGPAPNPIWSLIIGFWCNVEESVHGITIRMHLYK